MQGLLLAACATHASDPGPRWTCFARILSPALLPLIPLSSGAPAAALPAQQMTSSPTPPHAARLPAFVMWRRSECGCRGCCLLLSATHASDPGPRWTCFARILSPALLPLIPLSSGAPAAAPPALRTSSWPTPSHAARLPAFVMCRRSEFGCRGCCRLQPCLLLYVQ